MPLPSVNRRAFLAFAGTFAVTTTAGAFLLGRSPLGRLVRQPATTAPDFGQVLLPIRRNLAIFDFNGHRVRVIHLANEVPHSAQANPRDPRFVTIVDLDGPLISQVNVQRGTVDHVIDAGNLQFSGHVTYSPDGKLLYIPQYGYGQEDGKILVHDAASFTKLGELRSHGVRAHNVRLLKNGEVLVVGHMGGRGSNPDEPYYDGSLTFVSTKTGELLQKMSPPNPYWYMNHFDFDADGTIAISALTHYEVMPEGKPEAKRLTSLIAPLIFGRMGQSEWHYVLPEEIKGRMRHNHSLVIDRKRSRALVVHSHGYLVSIWDLRARKVLHTMDFGVEAPLGIAVDHSQDFYLFSSDKNKLHVVDAATFATLYILDTEKFGVPKTPGAKHIDLLPRLT